MSWLFVLECISKIDYYINYAQNHPKDNDPSWSVIADQTELAKGEVVRSLADIKTINTIFSKSNTFELGEIIDFITCLCKTSE